MASLSQQAKSDLLNKTVDELIESDDDAKILSILKLSQQQQTPPHSCSKHQSKGDCYLRNCPNIKKQLDTKKPRCCPWLFK